MTTTEAKHWQSGYSVRGNKRRFLAFRLGSYGVMLTNFAPIIELYKLV